MDRRGRKLRFTAVAVLVVLALTGFSTSRGHGHGHSSGHGGGGGCSSSSQDHDSSSSSSSGGTSGSRYRDYDDDDDDYTGGTSGGSSSSSSSSSSAPSTTLRDATVKLLSCASQNQPYAMVEITNPNATGGRFTVAVDFLDAGSDRLAKRTAQQYVAGNETTTVRVDLSDSAAAEVDHCEPEPYAPAA
ncbi:hypothetical protein QF032_003491 [Streptomyces achromogenes]|uniref:hypothetical protein n=1 Tax=Streptomyces achromogenes TaxID=67255 RepID=UPI002787EF35|nr:hypothetical protein [Streptomyces achromogenes]MDQ0831647.1 hypothetical protein [Streptomyces achromogenes]